MYGDQDTLAFSERCIVVADGEGGFDRQRTVAELRRAAAEGVAGLVYGSGLECIPELLEQASAHLPLCGNATEVLARLKSPRTFFSLLDSLGIPYPESCFERPGRPEGWLSKPGCGEGGKRVAFPAATAEAGDAYFQRHIAGTPMSALFLADGRKACLVGFNELWTEAVAGQPFLFAGAVNRPALDAFRREQVIGWVRRLVAETGLKGLNSLDFMVDGEACWVLEVNPRPSATLALYDEDVAGGLLAAHIRACAGYLPEALPVMAPRAWRIVYAPQRLAVPDDLAWPAWCADLPATGSIVEAGRPVCSVAAAGEGEDLRRLSRERQQAALALCRPA